MHSMWKGAISFGLVMIPVRLYAATEQRDISFRQVHRADGGRIRFRRFCSACGEEVPYQDVAKGYELPTGEMVVLADEDMAELPLPTAKAIEVLHFAPAGQLDPILFNRSYYVEPEAAGARAYVLLRDALEQSGRVAVAQVALRQRESLATLRSRDGVLVLDTLLWPDEVRSPLFPFLEQDIEVRPQELIMAASLIDSMAADFDAAAHHDRYREALSELVDAKVQGRELVAPVTAEIAAEPATSLTEALRASLAAVRGTTAGETAGEAAGEAARGAIEEGGAAPAARAVAAARQTGRKGRAIGAKQGAPEAAGEESEAARMAAGKEPGARKARAGKAGARRASTAKAGTKQRAAKSATAKPARKAS